MSNKVDEGELKSMHELKRSIPFLGLSQMTQLQNEVTASKKREDDLKEKVENLRIEKK